MGRFVAVGTLVASLLAGNAWAQKPGDWTHRTAPEHHAAAANGAGHVFGQWCELEDGNCVYLLAIPAPCEEGEIYPVLANSDSSANAVEITCHGPHARRTGGGPRLYRYVFSNFASIDHQVRHSKRIGFAFPTQGDGFVVSRFPLAGAVRAIDAMRVAAQRAWAAQSGRDAPPDARR